MDEIRQRVRADIDTHGWHVVKVAGDETLPGWAYTIGLLTRFDHPELAVFGLDLDPMHRLLNHAGGLIGTGQRFEVAGSYEGLLEGTACGMRPVARVWVDVFFGNAAWHHQRPDVPVVQCLWPDRAGRLPWEEGFDASLHELQPRLYETALERALTPRWVDTLRAEGALDGVRC